MARAHGLPVQQPRELELVLDMRAARALNLAIPGRVTIQLTALIG